MALAVHTSWPSLQVLGSGCEPCGGAGVPLASFRRPKASVWLYCTPHHRSQAAGSPSHKSTGVRGEAERTLV